MMKMRKSENVFGNSTVSKCVNQKASNNMKSFKVSSSSITDRSEKSVVSYFNEVSSISCIPYEEERRLLHSIKNGGREGERAKNALIEANLRFVVSVANHYYTSNKGSVLTLEDLIQEGNTGLVVAAEKFDESRDCKFITYASNWIRKYILEALRCNGTAVCVPLNQQKLVFKYKRAKREAEQRDFLPMSIAEFAASNDISFSKMSSALVASGRAVMADQPVGDGDSESKTTLADTFVSSESIESELAQSQLRDGVRRLLARYLNERETLIVNQYHGIGCYQMSLEEIGSRMGMSREGVRKIYLNALNKLRRTPLAKELAQYISA